MSNNPKHHRWFDLGAKKFRRWAVARDITLPEGEAVYPCPLCGNGFTKEALVQDILTAEDVPPKSVGGRKILLTCQPCNNDQGSEIDSHAVKREKFVDSLTGRRIWPFEGQHTVGDSAANVQTYFGPGQVGIFYVPGQNNPNNHGAYLEALDDPANITQRIRMRADFVWSKADLSYLRAAYLASFAALGWKQIFRPAFLPLLKRLAGDAGAEMPPILVRYDVNETSTENSMLYVTEDGPQQGVLLIRMGRSIVALPGPDDDRTLIELAVALAELLPNGAQRTFRGQVVPWPARPEHRCDPDPSESPKRIERPA
jgi:hypothetical protein